MSDRAATLAQLAADLEARLAAPHLADAHLADAAARARADLAAFRFHLNWSGQPKLIVLLGGTGTGKSTLLNRLLGQDISATSYRRTFTAGPIAVVPAGAAVPPQWLGVEHIPAADLPARGSPQSLAIVTALSTAPATHAPVNAPILVDTPDLDGDQPAHHAAADRAFRWATGVIFVVTPEKYQMTELLPYYRLADRYGIDARFIMNKAEGREVIEDYVRQLESHQWPDARVYAVERDDSAFAPPREQSLDALKDALFSNGSSTGTITPDRTGRSDGLSARRQDLVNRLIDQVIAPLRERQGVIDRTVRALRNLERADEPAAGVDVNPLTEQLRVRLQQRSILYLLGPQRVWDRVRQVPGLLLRLPRSIWSAARGRAPSLPDPEPLPATTDKLPDFAAALRDQFAVVQSRIEDLLRSDPVLAAWMDAPPASTGRAFAECRIDPAEAGRIADEEIAALRAWLEQRWNANPRDTLLVMKILRYLPGGQRITRAVEAAPYLLLIFFVVHPGHVLHEVIFGAGYAAVTHLMERLSNEVAARTRSTNRRIADRFAELAHRQIEGAIAWLNQQAPPVNDVNAIERAVNRLAEAGVTRP